MNSFVVDIGSSCTKVGYSGENLPMSVFPTAPSTEISSPGTEGVENPLFNPNNENYDKTVLMHRGLVNDWDEMEKFWQTVLNEGGVSASSTEKTPVLLIDSPVASISDRVKWAEILFEGYRAPSLCIGNSASLSIFAAGRTTGVVVDCGAGLTTSVPVFEGLALTHACIEMEYAGMDVSLKLQRLLKDVSKCPLNIVDAKLLKERMAYINTVAPAVVAGKIDKKAKATAEPADMKTLFLPDGKEVSLDNNIFGECTQMLFKNKSNTYGGLSASVYESLRLCDDSIRSYLMNNILISGGTSMLPGLGDRLINDLNIQFSANEGDIPSNAGVETRVNDDKVKVFPSTNYRESGYTQQRKYAAWTGGSIFASFESFQDLCVTKQEWEDGAETALLAKCF